MNRPIPSISIEWSVFLLINEHWIDGFLRYLASERNASEHTIENYAKDLHQFTAFLEERQLDDFKQVSYLNVRTYLALLNEQEYAKKSVSRKLSALRSFYQYLVREGRWTSVLLRTFERRSRTKGCRNSCIRMK
ncbi:site-specific integrase [Paenibacillus sp. CC-CFT747]|nr:site-specific integrase [Paenibacillus sp. CC-CFT747]